jgi:hypothetical protein
MGKGKRKTKAKASKPIEEEVEPEEEDDDECVVLDVALLLPTGEEELVPEMKVELTPLNVTKFQFY